jgi:tRNA/tmRNA/rRNA uracil-C5-methylase (TrmA/RlmC/RlmD family)
VVRITEVKAGSYCRGEAVTILRADPRRVVAPCAHFGPGGCGGCDFQHAAPDLQRELKAAVVAEQLRRLAGLDVPVTVEELAGGGFGWRSRVRWAVDRGDGVAGRGGDVVVGPRRYRSHAVVPVSSEAPCLIAGPGLTEASAGLRPPRGADEVVLARTDGDPPMVTWLRRGRQLRESTGGLTEHAGDRDFAVGATGFWQAHAHAADTLCKAVADALQDLDLVGAPAWDLYGGVGLFAAVLADLVGASGRVVTVEHDREASTLAAVNLREQPQALALQARVDAALKAAPDCSPRTPLAGPATASRRASLAPPSPTAHQHGLGGPVDAVVLDPPRSGAGPAVCRALADRGPAVIVYVACDPAALARDTAALMAAGYRLDTLRAFDAFPQTHHVECVARFLPTT